MFGVFAVSWLTVAKPKGVRLADGIHSPLETHQWCQKHLHTCPSLLQGSGVGKAKFLDDIKK